MEERWSPAERWAAGAALVVLALVLLVAVLSTLGIEGPAAWVRGGVALGAVAAALAAAWWSERRRTDRGAP